MAIVDKLDRKILAFLDRDGRMSTSDIARQVRHGRDIVAYRVQRAAEDEVWRGSEPIIDPAALGYGLYKTYLSFAQAGAALKRVHQRIRTHPSAYCVARAYGRWDLIFNVVATSPSHYSELRSSLLSGEETHLREIGFAVFTRMVYFNRKYLGLPPHSWSTMVGTLGHTVDESGRALLKQLAIDASSSDAELARATKMTPIMVRQRLSQFEKDGLIVGYRARLNRTVFELSSYKLHIDLRRFNPATTQKIETFAREHHYVTQFMLQLGAWPCELNVEAHDARHLTTIIDDLRNVVGEDIGVVDVTLYDRDEFTWGFGELRTNRELEIATANAA